MTTQVSSENISIVLQQPRYPENIGAAARAMHNMGLNHLRVVGPVNYDETRVKKMATHEASDIVERIQLFDTLNQAVAPYNYVIGTTARKGKQRQSIHTPAEMADKLLSISKNNRVAVVFGPEDHGLTNQDLTLCHALVNIPTSGFSSINLAQAVMIMCYSIRIAVNDKKGGFTPRMATRHELEGMYEQLKDVLVRICYINPENPDYWMNKIRQFLNRVELRAREVSVIRGICRQIDWYGNRRRTENNNKRSKK